MIFRSIKLISKFVCGNEKLIFQPYITNTVHIFVLLWRNSDGYLQWSGNNQYGKSILMCILHIPVGVSEHKDCGLPPAFGVLPLHCIVIIVIHFLRFS